MGRIFVIISAILGTALLLALLYAPARNVAFSVGTVGITWVMLAGLAMGFLAYKVTK